MRDGIELGDGPGRAERPRLVDVGLEAFLVLEVDARPHLVSLPPDTHDHEELVAVPVVHDEPDFLVELQAAGRALGAQEFPRLFGDLRGGLLIGAADVVPLQLGSGQDEHLAGHDQLGPVGPVRVLGEVVEPRNRLGHR